MMCSFTIAHGHQCTGRKSPPKSVGVLGSIKETQTVASSPIRKNLVTSWRFVFFYHNSSTTTKLYVVSFLHRFSANLD